jgi:hypothetical protein
MKTEVTIELENIAPALLPLRSACVYALPANYFFGLDQRVLLAVKKQAANTVPDGYFDTLSDRILQKIKLTAVAQPEIPIETTFELPATPTPYHLPAGYFAQLNDVLTNKLAAEQKTDKKAKVLSLKWMRYAAAACVLALAILATVELLKPKDQTNNPELACVNLEDCLSDIDDATILNYLNKLSVDEQYIDEGANPIDEQKKLEELELNEADLQQIDEFVRQAGSGS